MLLTSKYLVVDWWILITNWLYFIFIGASRRLQDQNILLMVNMPHYNFIVIPETCEAVYLSLKVYFNNSNRVYVYDNFHEEHLQFLTFLSKINKHQDLASKRCSVPLCFRLFVGELVSYLRYLCLFAYGGVQHMLFVLFVFILCFVYPMLPVSLDCPVNMPH
jgi:hypothetical protein